MNPTTLKISRFMTQEKFKHSLCGGSIPTTGYFIIGSYVDSTNAFSVSQTPTQHSTEEAAKAEAERLSKAYTSKKFIVLKIMGMVKTTATVWE